MKQYLLDTNILIFYLKGMYDLDKKFDEIGLENCFISEISIAELLHGAEKSRNPIKHLKLIIELQLNISTLPITNALGVYAKEKARLEKAGKTIDNFDLLIGATAIINNLIMVTNNTKHFNRINDIKLEDWVNI